MPKRHAEELAPLLEKGYRAEVVGRDGGVLTVEVAARDAGPRREQFRLAAYPRSKEERKRVKKLALNSRVFFWEEDGKLEVLDHEGYALGAIKVGDYERVRAACAGAYAAKATLDADGSLSVSVSYIVKSDVAAAPTSRESEAGAESIDKAAAESAAATTTEVAGAGAESAEAAATETADDVSAEDDTESPHVGLGVMAYPRSLDEEGRIAALAPGSEVFFLDEGERLELLDAEGNVLGAIKIGDFERVRAAISGAYEAKATPNGKGALYVHVLYAVEPESEGPEIGPEAEDSSHQDGGSSSEFLEKLNEVLDRIGRKNVAIIAGAVALIAVLVVFWPCSHVYADATCTEPATCTKCGKTEGDALGHDYEVSKIVEATCIEDGYTVFTCSRCGKYNKGVFVDALGHDYETIEIVEATCTEEGYTVYTCSQCGNSYEGDTVDALGHTVDEWNVDVEATCIETGSKSGTCIVCGENVTESIAKTDHTEGSWETVSEPSVSVSGDSVYVVPGEKQLACTVCGEVLETQEIDMEIGETYSSGSYRVGTDIPAGEYKIFCSGSVDAYYCVYPDTSQEDILDNDNFSECAYVKVSDGQLLEVKRAVFVSIDDAWSTTDLVGSGVYKVGLDLEAGEYEIVAYSGEKGYYCVWDSADAETRKIVNNDNFEGTAYITVKKGQYLEISRASADKTS